MKKLSGLLVLPLLAVIVFWLPLRSHPQTAQKANPAAGGNTISLQITFGYLRRGERVFDGSLQVSGGRLLKLEPWRFFAGDAIQDGNRWKLRTRKIVFENQPDQPNTIPTASPSRNLVPAGVIATIDQSANSVRVSTAQGDFTIPIADLTFGRVRPFLDGDVLVQRVVAPAQLSANNTEEHDYPSVGVAKQGVVWFAWQAYKDRGDHVYAMPEGGAPQVITDAPADIYRTSIAVDAEGRIHVAWSERNQEDWQLWERTYDGRSWSPRAQISSGHSPNIFHKLIASDGRLRIVWVGHQGGRSFLYLAEWKNGAWSPPTQIGGPSVWSPDAASDQNGNLYVAWDSYQNGNYDIFFRKINASGAADPIEQITSSPKFQAHASVAVDNRNRPWLAWDESGVNWGKDWTHTDAYRSTVLYRDRTVRVVVKEGAVWKEAPDFSAAVPDRLRRYAQLPHLVSDANGDIWALFQMRTSAINNREDFWTAGGLWDLYLTRLDGNAWLPASLVPHSTSRNEQPFQAASAPGRILMTWTNDGRDLAGINGGYNGATMVHYDVFAASQPNAATLPADPASLSVFQDAAGGAGPVHPNEKADVEKMRSYRATVAGTEFRILRGDFHRHTDISADGSGDGSLEDYYRYMIDVADMDTGIVSDHNQGGDVEYNWWRTEKSYDVFHIPGRYTPLFGYERSVPYPNGHRNVVFAERGTRTLPIGDAENSGKKNSGPILYPYLRQHRGICMEHSLATGQGTDYRDNDPELEPLVEIYQGYHAAYEYEGAPRAETSTNFVSVHGGYRPAGFWWNALAKGLKLGVQASSDHISTHTSYAMIYTPTTNRGDIVESMRQRHAYAATDNILVDFESEATNGARHLMGDAFADPSGRVKLIAKVEGTDEITQIDLIRNGKFIYTRAPHQKSSDFEYVDQSPETGESYYYLRVMQKDGNLAWASPIWIQR
jgi:hypothetical protein